MTTADRDPSSAPECDYRRRRPRKKSRANAASKAAAAGTAQANAGSPRGEDDHFP
jgi:hypothetical protein